MISLLGIPSSPRLVTTTQAGWHSYEFYGELKNSVYDALASDGRDKHCALRLSYTKPAFSSSSNLTIEVAGRGVKEHHAAEVASALRRQLLGKAATKSSAVASITDARAPSALSSDGYQPSTAQQVRRTPVLTNTSSPDDQEMHHHATVFTCIYPYRPPTLRTIVVHSSFNPFILTRTHGLTTASNGEQVCAFVSILLATLWLARYVMRPNKNRNDTSKLRAEPAILPADTASMTADELLVEANHLVSEGFLGKAKDMYIAAILMKEAAVGADDLTTLSTVNNLAVLLQQQGELEEATRLYLQALGARERVLGAEHADTLRVVNNLAVLYSDQGKLDEALNMFRRALKGQTSTLGAAHAETLDTINNMAILLSSSGAEDEAIELYEQLLAGQMREITSEESDTGVLNPAVLRTMFSLASLLKNQGSLAESEALFIRGLQGCEATAGSLHADTLTAVHCLAIVQYHLGTPLLPPLPCLSLASRWLVG